MIDWLGFSIFLAVLGHVCFFLKKVDYVNAGVGLVAVGLLIVFVTLVFEYVVRGTVFDLFLSESKAIPSTYMYLGLGFGLILSGALTILRGLKRRQGKRQSNEGLGSENS